jgi:hypothetical protein
MAAAGDCDQFGGACASLTGDAAGICLPACFSTGTTPPSGWPHCGTGLMCDPNALSGACVMTITPGGTGANGDPCMANTDCAGGICRMDTDMTTGAATGFANGYCVSEGRFDGSALMMGHPIPQSNCPAGSGAFPFSNLGQGDVTECWKTCGADTDCRQGYLCDHFQSTSTHAQFFTNGFCVPANCADTTMPHGACPSGYTCAPVPTDAATPEGVCTPGTATDAGHAG